MLAKLKQPGRRQSPLMTCLRSALKLKIQAQITQFRLIRSHNLKKITVKLETLADSCRSSVCQILRDQQSLLNRLRSMLTGCLLLKFSLSSCMNIQNTRRLSKLGFKKSTPLTKKLPNSIKPIGNHE